MLTACSKMDDPQPTPDPAVQFTMTRTMTFATAPNHVNGVTHAQKKQWIAAVRSPILA